ncbi:MAG: MlaE family lipid ABC transporter permease subunit [Planctomycetes bacterium]|jgi:phospholipid/cholesterol/gamma-HCH transport system permease protein|nr:MlaE family lipid ABC transporter permease subunit [Planctomycetota bacterium]
MSAPILAMPERLDRTSALAVHESILAALETGEGDLRLDFGGVGRADAIGVAAILEAFRETRRRGRRLRLLNVAERHRRLFAFLRVDGVLADEPGPAPRERLLGRIGGWWMGVRHSAVEHAALHVDAVLYTFVAPFRGRGLKAAHFWHQLTGIGAGAVGIVAMVSFLIGLIMALQAALVLKDFGAVIYVANMVGVTMTRELGPLLTAVILAARTGSSIAAELGTMVVTEEVDALRVMDVEPRRFLVAPRFAALAVALPCLATLSDAAGIAGGFAVATVGLGIGFEHYWIQTVTGLHVSDLVTGLVKSFVFANVIAIVSCHEGLAIRGGPEEVGRATTRAVVTSIILVIVSDFVFTTLFYFLG